MNYQPCMSDPELALLNKYTPLEGNVIEFGAGGSSQFFLENNVKHLVSVESDKTWLKKLLQSPEISVRYKHKKWTPIHGNIGHTEAWGVPVDKKPDISWLNYHQYCWENIKQKSFDLVLIDGRFRVACLLQTLLHCENTSLTIMFHDFWDREYYHCVLDFINVIDRADTLAVFQPKENIDWIRLSLTLQKYQFDFL